MARSNFEVKLDNVAQVAGAIETLAKTKVMVGIPAKKGLRSGGPISNAALGYIHEFGAPEANIPPRPFLLPTVKAKQKGLIVPALNKAGKAALTGDLGGIERILSILGQEVSDAVRTRIVDFIPPPLKPGTLIGRARRLASYQNASKKRRKTLREKALQADATPLIDTGQLLKSITWVLRKG